MSKKELKILMLEDDSFDAELNKEQLSNLPDYNGIIQLVSTKEAFVDALDASLPDIILSDYNLPTYSGLEALLEFTKRKLLIPFIFVTGATNEETAVDAIKAGAWDYVVKDRLYRLPLAVTSALKLRDEKLMAAKAENEINKLIRAIEQTNVQMVISDKLGRIEYANIRYLEVSGYDLDEVSGKNMLEHILNADNENVEEVKQKLNSDKGYRGESLSKRKDGTTYWELVSISPIRNDSQEITNFVAVKEDISQRKKMEQDIIVARDEAQRSNKLKEAFLHNMSHEIRTPLNAIVGFSDLLQRNNNQNKDTIDYFTSIIRNSSQQLLSIVTDVLTISSIETGQVKVYSNPIEVCELFNYLVEVFDSIAKEKNIKLEISSECINQKCTFSTDKEKLTQILSNLVNNAIKFTEEGLVSLSYEYVEDGFELKVSDTGIGINQENLQFIFDRFRQAESDTHIKYGGTGLGLSISQAFAKMLGGKIKVSSTPNVGSEFILWLPIKKEEKEKEKVEKSNSGFTIDKKLKVLVAEDEMFNFLLLKSILSTNSNIIIEHAMNGKEAVDLFNQHNDFDLVLMDIKMPILNGEEAFREIHKLNKDIPVIAQTAYSTDADIARFLKMGFTDCLIKPISVQTLLHKISKVV